MNWIYGGLCVIGIGFMYFMAYALCRAAAAGDAMMERHLQYLREQEAAMKISSPDKD